MISPINVIYEPNASGNESAMLWCLSEISFNVGRFHQSICLAHLATEQEPRHEQRYMNHYIQVMRMSAELAEEIGDWGKARYYWMVLTKNIPQDIEVSYGIAIAEANLGNYNVAIRYLKHVLEQNPGHEKARSLLMNLQHGS